MEYADAEDDIFEVERLALAGEVVIERYHRRPVLDHIIPHFLGGDGPENWQVLCASCNSGKGEGLAWILRRGLLPPSKLTEALTITASLRYAVLASYLALNGNKRRMLTAGEELRLFRKDSTRLPVFDNLEVRCL